jgi:phosphatidylglycerophosphate synthase
VRPVRVKPQDLCWTVYVIDPLAVPLVERLRDRAWVTPDRLTLMSAIVACVAAALFATGAFAIGGVVYQLAFLLDCMDGKLASIRGKRHSWGGWYDAAGDCLRVSACTTGLAAGLYRAGFTAPWQVAALVLYPCVRFATVMLVSATRSASRPAAAAAGTPRRPAAGPLELQPTPAAVLRAAPARRLTPGSTVDTEAVAFTLGPLSTFPFVGLLVALAVDALHVAYMVLAAVRSASREARAPALAE